MTTFKVQTTVRLSTTKYLESHYSTEEVEVEAPNAAAAWQMVREALSAALNKVRDE